MHEAKYHIDRLPFSISKGTPFKYKDGVILSKIPYTEKYGYHATAIASRAMMDDKEAEQNINWLLENMDKNGAYKHEFVFPYYPMEKGWIGGLAQGLATSALLKHGYKAEAKKTYSAMKKYCFNGKSIEEYPGIEILNGWIYSIFAIYDMKDESFFNLNIKNLKDKLRFYDLGKWSRYDAYDKIPSTLFYHEIHIKQLIALWSLTDDPYFKDLAKKWELFSKTEKKINMIKRNWTIVRKHGIIGTYKKYKQMKQWKGD